MTTADTRLKRARAVVDFERVAGDELGFRRHDLVTVVRRQDEHCWVGELRGHTGWFPAQFVEVVTSTERYPDHAQCARLTLAMLQLLDERSAPYSRAGDDSVHRAVTDLVRGPLASALKQVLEQGLRRGGLLAAAAHPWQFIEEAASEVVQPDYNSVFSRLVLCKTFKYNLCPSLCNVLILI